MDKIKLFVDMDGTIAKFHENADFLKRMYEPGYFISLNPFTNVIKIITEFYLNNIEIVDLYIITGAPSCCLDRIYEEKKSWLLKHFPALNIDNFICVPMGTNKADFIEHIDSSCYLIDDYNKNLEDWERAGGIGIKLVNDSNDKGSIGPKWQGKRLYYNSIEKFVL